MTANLWAVNDGSAFHNWRQEQMRQHITNWRITAVAFATILTMVSSAARAAPMFSDLTSSASVSVSDFYPGFSGSNMQDAAFFGTSWYTGNPVGNQAIGTYTWGTTQHVGYVLLSGGEAGRLADSVQLQYSVDGSTNWTNAGAAKTPAAQSLFYVPVDLNVKGLRVVLNSSSTNQALSGFYVYGNNDLAHPVQMVTATNLFSQATESHTGTWETDGTGFSALADTNVEDNSTNYVRANAFAAGAPPTMTLTYAQDKSLSGLALANQAWYYTGGMIYGMHIDALNTGIDPNLATAGDWTTVYTYSDNTDTGLAKLISAQFDNAVVTRALRLVITDISNTANNADRAGGGISEIDVIGGLVPEPASMGLLMLAGVAMLGRRVAR
jgi:hypothetical protein